MESTWKLLKKFAGLLKEFRNELIIAVILMIVSVALMTYAPKLFGKLINQFLSIPPGTKHHHIPNMMYPIAKILVVYIIALLLEIPINRIMSKISEKNNSNLRIALYRKLDTLSFDRFNSEYSGDIVARFNNDIPNIKMFISKTVIRLITDALIILFTITMIFTIKLDLSGIFACFIPVYILIIYYSYVKTKKYYKDHQNDLGNLVGMLGEYLPRRLMFHSFGVKKYLENQITSYNDKQEESFVKSRFYSEAFNPLNFLIINFLQLGLYIIAGFYVLDGTIDVGTFSAFILYIQLFKRPVLTMGFILNSVKLSFASLDRIFEILDMDEDEPTGGANLDCSNLKGEIEIKDVCHGNLDDFSLKIHSRECVKITGYYYDLADVILRLKTPAKGSIYLDGQDIS